MKTYVIKNEEGKYLTETFDWADDLYFAMIYDETHLLSNKQEHWQEVTIAEGDLEKENKMLNEALYWACNYITRIVDKDVNKLAHEWADYFIQKAKEELK